MTHDIDFERKTAEILNQEAQFPAGWWWCSFVDKDGFLGVAIVWARGILTATKEARRRGINPGGQVLAYEIAEPPEQYRNRLLDRAETLEAKNIIEKGKKP
jgi:hypothetical protein